MPSSPAAVGLVHGLAVRRRPRLDRLSARGQAPGAGGNRANRGPGALAHRASRSTQQVLGPDGEVAAEGQAVVVAWDPDTRSARPIGDEDRTLLASRLPTERRPRSGSDRPGLLMKTIIVGYDGTSSAPRGGCRARRSSRPDAVRRQGHGGQRRGCRHRIDWRERRRIRADALLDVRGRARRSPQPTSSSGSEHRERVEAYLRRSASRRLRDVVGVVDDGLPTDDDASRCLAVKVDADRIVVARAGSAAIRRARVRRRGRRGRVPSRPSLRGVGLVRGLRPGERRDRSRLSASLEQPLDRAAALLAREHVQPCRRSRSASSRAAARPRRRARSPRRARLAGRPSSRTYRPTTAESSATPNSSRPLPRLSTAATSSGGSYEPRRPVRPQRPRERLERRALDQRRREYDEEHRVEDRRALRADPPPAGTSRARSGPLRAGRPSRAALARAGRSPGRPSRARPRAGRATKSSTATTARPGRITGPSCRGKTNSPSTMNRPTWARNARPAWKLTSARRSGVAVLPTKRPTM